MSRVAIGINLAAIKLRALVLVGQKIIGARGFREFLCRLGVILVAIGVKLLGKLAIGALDLGFGRRAGYAQSAVRVTHPR